MLTLQLGLWQYLDLGHELVDGHGEDLTVLGWDNNLGPASAKCTMRVIAGKRTFAMSVTLIALNNRSSSSTVTATLLTPSSLINDIASNTVDVAVTATTDE